MPIEFNDLTFTNLGHASVHIETSDGQTLYIDPWSEVLGDQEPHDADIVFVTHDDVDHYDPDAIERVSTDETTIIAYEGVDTSDLTAAEAVWSLSQNEELTVDGITVQAIPAYNRADGTHIDENGSPFHAQGEVIGLWLSIAGTVVYFASDTDFLDEHEELSGTVDVFIPPIGGHYTMDRHEAAAFAESLDPSLVLPVHYDTFEAIETDADGHSQVKCEFRTGCCEGLLRSIDDFVVVLAASTTTYQVL
ncbi:MAG: MBL fold metallo-hydrolase [Euryarchaeota archaeon]|nr:MBL fold metallo-hydrolase [Euryarchaeota archaeon]